ncbi:hypothetical protein GGX14DRAFT_389571 [Mycena pura]|uniref:Fork-head domain-containing protein n=1 Tax=Mycena pura TaxID=153505 RepID=A0AAD6VQY0_9AGAR|nr:hypothetical protein GGX14DRAFT_389571 [Mycena pura]
MSLWNSLNDPHVKAEPILKTIFKALHLGFELQGYLRGDYKTDQENNRALDDPVDAFFTAGDSDAFDRPEFYGCGGIAIEDSSLQVHDGVDDGRPSCIGRPSTNIFAPGCKFVPSCAASSGAPTQRVPATALAVQPNRVHARDAVPTLRRPRRLVVRTRPPDWRSPTGLATGPDQPRHLQQRKKMLSLQGIHQAIVARFPFYRGYEAWQGSIRHALSLYSIFKMRNREGGDRGKGHYWTLDIAELKKDGINDLAARVATAEPKRPERRKSLLATEVRIRSASGSHSTRTRLEQAREISSPAVAALGNNRDAIRSAVLSSGARDLQGPIRASRTLWHQASANPTAVTVSPASVEVGARRAGGRARSGKQPPHGGKDIL